MSRSLSVTLSGTPLPSSWVSRDLMRALGDWTITRIRTRTQAGLDADQRPFRPYSPSYAALKAEALKTGRRVTLQVSGRMLNEMVTETVGDRAVRVMFKAGGGTGGRRAGTFIQRSRAVAGAEKAYYHAVVGAGRSRVIRDFFGVNEQDMAALTRKVDAFLRRVIRTGRA